MHTFNRYFSYSLLVVFLLFASNCHSHTTKEILLTGVVNNTDESTVLHYHDQYGLHQIMLDEGHFKLHLFYDGPVVLRIESGKGPYFEVYAQPGDTMHVAFDWMDLQNSLRSVTFSGDKTPENAILRDLQSILIYDEANQTPFYDCSQDVFLTKISALSTQAKAIIAAYHPPYPDQDFINVLTRYLDYTIGYYISRYPDVNASAFARRNIILEPAMVKKLETFPLERPNLLNHAAYRQFLEYRAYQLLEAYVNRLDIKKPEERFAAQMSAIDSIFSEAAIQTHLKYVNLLYQFSYQSRFDASSYYEDFIQEHAGSLYEQRLSILYKEASDALHIGSQTPDFTLEDVNGQLLQLSSLRGKYVYIDFWATWCAPCVREHPYFKKLVNRFAETNELAFVGISIDHAKEKWKQMVLDRKLPGIQLIGEKAADSQIAKAFQVLGIPRFVILDKEGKVLDADAPRPSSVEIVELLENLL